MRARQAVARWFKSYMDWQEEWGRVVVSEDDELGGEVLYVDPFEDFHWSVSRSFEVKGWVEESGMPVVMRHLHGSETYAPRAREATDTQSKSDDIKAVLVHAFGTLKDEGE